MISIICPTIPERANWLRASMRAFCETTDNCEFLIVEGAPNVNAGWNIGIQEARGEYICLSADDLEPHRGWVGEAIWWAEQDILPCPRILNSDGSLQSCGDHAREELTGAYSAVCRIPFLKREWLSWAYPVPDEMHYMGDYWITRQGLRNGVPTQVVRELCFTHHMVSVGRLDTLERDIELYEALP